MISKGRGSLASKVRLLQWSAWAPGISGQNRWLDFFRTGKRSEEEGAPDVADIASLLRRRMSKLTRMSVSVALDCCRRAAIPASDVHVVFASRHGEMGETVNLLNQLVNGETPSPMGFSGSVHHTALGFFSLATANRRAMRAISGGEASFCYGFLDAMGLLTETNSPPVLLVAADETVPAPFADLIGKNNFSYAAAFLLGRSDHPRGRIISLNMPSRRFGFKRKVARATSLGIPALDFLRWSLEEKRVLEWCLSKRVWRWEK